MQHFIKLLCFFYLLVLPETISTAYSVSFLSTPDIKVAKSYAVRRLRAPLMGRSIVTSLNDDKDFVNSEMNDSDEEEPIKLSRRRLVLDFLPPQRMAYLKKKGPLFG